MTLHLLGNLLKLKPKSSANGRVYTSNIIHYARHLSGLAAGSGQPTEIRSENRTFKSEGASFRILSSAESGTKLSQTHLAGSNIELDDLECSIAGQKSVFNLTWLRDSCHCIKCTHKHSRQRLFNSQDFRKDLFAVADVQLISQNALPTQFVGPTTNGPDNRYLNINWVDGHASFYSLNWLDNINSLYEKSQLYVDPRSKPKFLLPSDDFYSSRTENHVEPEHWTVCEINSKLEPIDYNSLIDGFKFHDDNPTFINANHIGDMTSKRFNSMLSLTNQLTSFGLAKIVNVPQERNQVLKVARSLAYERSTGYGTVFDVVVEPSEEINLAYSSQEFDLHSDLTYREKSPGVQLLHCIKDSVDGGSSYFSDAFNAAEILRKESPGLFEVLVQFPAVFVVRDPYRDVKFRRQKQILTLNQQDKLDEVYYSPFMLPPVGFKDDLKLFYIALDRFTQLLQREDNKLITKMKPGDLFVFHNRRVLHGRSSYDPTKSNRFLQGCYMDWDEIRCLHEKLNSSN